MSGRTNEERRGDGAHAPVEVDRRTRWGAAASLIIPAVLVVAVLFALVAMRGGIESAIANLSALLPVGYAFSAGMVASVNPCGFMLLPTYLLYQLGAPDAQEGKADTQGRVLRALYLGGMATLGFVAVFAVVGGLVAAGGRWLNAAFPYGRVVIGVAMAGLGIWLLATRRTLGLMAASRVTITPKRTPGNVFLFGIVYAVGSLSCTLPIFLVVVGSALTSRDWLGALGQFLGYALGMSTVFVAVTVAAAFLRQAALRAAQRTALYVHRFSALLLVGIGIYLVYDWIVSYALTA